ncbi:MAG: carboxynorspermidine decarboxylase [Lachnospiraceae bacterium]|nr:carboxynorspermidine decarboxylase [Lachnospiraceae bacterium]
MKISELPTPAYVVDEGKLTKNLEVLKGVQERTGCKILLAQKAFSMFSEYPLIGKYLTGTTASGLYEARLGKEEMGKENHIFSPAYRESEIDEIAEICDHVIFNSFSQLERFRDRCREKTSIGLRINPECSTQGEHAIYDPCAPGSRLGVTQEAFERQLKKEAAQSKSAETECAATRTSGDGILDGVEGLHFHTLCEQNSDDLETTLQAVEQRFGTYLKHMKWLNMGGGHHITRADYDIGRLERCICHMRDTYDLDIYLEPGEAVALNAGYLVTEVMDIVENAGIQTLILDASAACHMPDVLEMPYRPPLCGSGQPGEKSYTYRLSSCTCLAGDIIGDYSFDREMHPGDRLYFEDMAIYSMVKNNTFNGIALPSIWVMEASTDRMEQPIGAAAEQAVIFMNECQTPSGECRLVKAFRYEDFKGRLS